MRPGEAVAAYGVGGLGINTVEGARCAWAKNVVAIDSLENKREKAMDLGLTMFPTAEEAQEVINATTTRDRVGFRGPHRRPCPQETAAVGKAAVVVLTGMNKLGRTDDPALGMILPLLRKSVKGSLSATATR